MVGVHCHHRSVGSQGDRREQQLKLQQWSGLLPFGLSWAQAALVSFYAGFQ